MYTHIAKLRFRKSVKICLISGAVVGGLFDNYFESQSVFVNHGHRNNNHGDSVYQIFGDLLIFPPTVFVVIPFLLWMSPGIYLNKKLDQIIYPERWNPYYRSPAYIRFLEPTASRSGDGIGGSGNPQIGKFF
jgi:hypothetical protein